LGFKFPLKIFVEDSQHYAKIQKVLNDIKLNKTQKAHSDKFKAMFDFVKTKRLSKSDDLLNNSGSVNRRMFFAKRIEHNDGNIAKKKKSHKKICINQIGSPENFVHVHHIGI
jgi:hypothetical protein